MTKQQTNRTGNDDQRGSKDAMAAGVQAQANGQQTNMKSCLHCKTNPAAGESAVSPNYKHLCRECWRKACAKQRRTEKGRAYIREYSKKRYQKFKQKGIARALVSKRVKDGSLTKPNYCSSCLNETTIYGHHENYDKPLEVIWLCEPCHKNVHGRLADLTLIKSKTNKEHIDEN